ncbi:MAG TPA: Rieske 2Fe-2S domain-containing protein [Candidatus Saccharimonadales bacterium]|nr:Rieske 2Fe-2S domain-containing protein [Candidatus Saccharimonadales bacterium]
MGSRSVDAVQTPTPGAVIRAARDRQVDGLSRRQLLRRAVAAGVGLWLVEVGAGTIGFLWSAVASATPKVRIGTFDDLQAANPGLPLATGYPVYVPAARAFIVLVDPTRGGWLPGTDPTGAGSRLNVRAMSQRCPHLGCRPNFCPDDRWFHCPCHQSRYDRLGTKAEGERFGPAPRSLDRYAIEVDAQGVLTVDTSRITLGPLPVALGQPGIIPSLVPNGCV